ncbi:hypothetical protein L21SP5_03591 [Salinivirga cyanobacteriivorans]|uniref:Uncharacterized protein n=1 Tax=Salinivirga cyanobacteriivorans TaxID=1307839 RepID=A0A0S2I4U1_9BACT|nr:hypothetical protein [Salinivirga cyanobacteriivorans]ALO17197.1 hypothetical protein L21SP5_03591 [Salinivirga cyanobacteriivorans]
MSNKRTVKKKIKDEYQRLEEDILHYMSVNKNQELTKPKAQLSELKEARKNFVSELNHAEKVTGQFVNDLLKKVVDDVDKRYKDLKALISKK